MWLNAGKLAHPQLRRVAFGVRNDQQIGWDRAAVRVPEASADVVTGWPPLGRVEAGRVLKQLLHPVRVRHKNVSDIRLRGIRLCEPPNGVDCVLRSNLSLVDPLDRRRKL